FCCCGCWVNACGCSAGVWLLFCWPARDWENSKVAVSVVLRIFAIRFCLFMETSGNSLLRLRNELRLPRITPFDITSPGLDRLFQKTGHISISVLIMLDAVFQAAAERQEVGFIPAARFYVGRKAAYQAHGLWNLAGTQQGSDKAVVAFQNHQPAMIV